MAEYHEPIPPGEILLTEFLEPLKVSQNQLARDIDVPVSRIAAIVKGERAISADTALRLAKFFSTSPEMWLRLQATYDLRRAQRTTWPEIERRIRPHGCLKHPPLAVDSFPPTFPLRWQATPHIKPALSRPAGHAVAALNAFSNRTAKRSIAISVTVGRQRPGSPLFEAKALKCKRFAGYFRTEGRGFVERADSAVIEKGQPNAQDEDKERR